MFNIYLFIYLFVYCPFATLRTSEFRKQYEATRVKWAPGTIWAFFLFPFPFLFTKLLHNFSAHGKQLGSFISEVIAIEVVGEVIPSNVCNTSASRGTRFLLAYVTASAIMWQGWCWWWYRSKRKPGCITADRSCKELAWISGKAHTLGRATAFSRRDMQT